MKLGVLGFYLGATNLGISDPKGSWQTSQPNSPPCLAKNPGPW